MQTVKDFLNPNITVYVKNADKAAYNPTLILVDEKYDVFNLNFFQTKKTY